MYAIIETGGKQYRVTAGDVVALEKLSGDVGTQVTFDKILLIGGQAGDQVLVGTPYVASAKLQAEIVAQDKGEKLLTIKYRRRKGYRRTIGHRQLLTKLLVTKIDDGKGHTMQFDAAKRADALRKASVAFSKRQAEHEAKHASAGKKTATKKAAGEEAAPKKRAAAKKTK